jgi:hypothetical protein
VERHPPPLQPVQRLGRMVRAYYASEHVFQGLGACAQRRHGAQLDQLAIVNYGYAVAEPLHHLQHVRRQEHGCAAPHLMQQDLLHQPGGTASTPSNRLAPGGSGDFVDQLSLGGCGGGVLIKKLLDVALIGVGVLGGKDGGAGRETMAQRVEG